MRPPKRSTLVIILLVLAVAVMSLTAAVAAASLDSTGGKITVPKLKPVPKVVKVKSTKKPPKNVKFRGQPMPGGITSGTGTAAGGPGEVIIPGVAAYGWWDGCGPTAVGMVVGYYDGHGWDNLIPGDASTDTPAVYQSIASHGSATAPGSYEDFALPRESSSSVLADKSEAPVGDEHASNSVADFMHTSWSADGLPYGWSFSNMVGPGLTGYVRSKYPNSSPVVATYGGSNLTWSLVTQEMNAARPMVFLVDSNGDGMTDHFVTVVAYRETNGYPEYGCWDTWDQSLLRWQRFRTTSNTYAWGVWGGFTFNMSGAVAPPPTPSPTPTPESTPTAPPPASSDTVAPVTAAQGLDSLWHNAAVTVTLNATDDSSGVAYTEFSLDGAAWTRGTSVTVNVPRKTGAGVVHTLEYRSVDSAGNEEAVHLGQVKIDTIKPVTSSNVDGLVHKGSFALVLTPKDGDSGVDATYYKVDGGTYKAGTSVGVTGAGRHTVRFYSVDGAGNIELTRSVTVRIG